MFSGRVPPELKRMADLDERTNQQLLQDALWRELGSVNRSRVERRIEEKEQRIGNIKREKSERERELEREREQLEALKAKLDKMDEERTNQRRQVLESLSAIPADPEHPGVKERADTLDMEPEALAQELAEYHNKKYQDPDEESDDYRSI